MSPAPAPWLPASLRPEYPPPARDAERPLLPTHGDDEEDIGFDPVERRSSRLRTRAWRYRWYLLVVPLSFVVLLIIGLKRSDNTGVASPSGTPQHPPSPDASHRKVDAYFARQSSTLEQAASRYRLQNGRAPPAGYAEWFEFAREHKCLIDEYAQIARDFEPFYQLADEDPEYFKRVLDAASDKIHAYGMGLTTGVFENGEFSYNDRHAVMYTNSWPRTMARFAHLMPNMSLILNGRDEPRVLFNYRKIPEDMRHQALAEPDALLFQHSPKPTGFYLKNTMGCLIPNADKGFTEAGNDASAFMQYASSTEFTTGLSPVLSVTKVSPCFSDILVPSEFYYSDSEFAARYAYPDNVDWSNKTEQIYWRGSSTGGHITSPTVSPTSDYHTFPRFRLVDISRTERGKPLMDVALSAFHDYLCNGCDAEGIKAEYGIVRAGSEVKAPREEVYRYKYLMDVDGNSFSGRYHGLLKSGSLVFKSTIFTEYFSDWLQPYEHYIPVMPDLSDLLDKIEWAKANDAEARAIQQAGKAFADRVLTDAQFDCYFSLVLLEWGRLQAIGEEAARKRVEQEAEQKATEGEGEALD
ncbi:CAP10 domain-containing protein [Mycena kentingensis (nom. inval.)]|nr:CAP10 domain-containing protein [Mycena kentingensis (nom. inval.)]